MTGAADIKPLRLQEEFQRLRSDVKILEEKHWRERTDESLKAYRAKLEEMYAYIRAHKDKVAGIDADRPIQTSS
jgi:hypothetical protein